MGIPSWPTLDPATGEPSSTARLHGELAVRVVSADGSRVALMAPPADGQEPWEPVPRSSTAIVVADAAGAEAPQRYRLRGNFEPEAFSSDGGHLFLISYVPPLDPSAYRVASLDLALGSGWRTSSAATRPPRRRWAGRD